MAAFKFQGFSTGTAVALSVDQGALSDSASVPSWGQSSSGSLTLSVSANRLSGTAPMGVLFAADATSDAARVTSPFHDIESAWDFDNPGSYTALGAAPLWGADRNIAYGPETTHVFAAPGTYEVRCQATDGESVLTETITITVNDPDVVFTGADTAVVSQVSDFTDAPAGAAQFTSLTAAMAHLSGRTAQRLLLRAGETFNGGVTFDESGGSNHRFYVGRFGPGANPKISDGSLKFRGDAGNVAEANVDRVDIEHGFDPTDPYNSPFGNIKGIDFAGGAKSILNAHKTVWGCHLKTIRDIAIEVDGSGSGAGQQSKNFYCGDTHVDGWWNYAFLSGDGGNFGFCGCRFNHPTGTVNGRNSPKFTEATALHASFRLSRVDGSTIFSNCDFNSLVDWSSSSSSRSMQPIIRWNTNSTDQKLVVDRLRCEGGPMNILNGTPQTVIHDNWVVIDRVHHIHSCHSKAAITSPMGGVTFRNYICVIPDNAPGVSTGIQGGLFTDNSDRTIGSGAQSRRSEFYSGALVDLRSDANARSRSGNQDRPYNAGGFSHVAGAFFGNNIQHAPNMVTGGTTGHGPLEATPTFSPQGGLGEIWADNAGASLTPDPAMAYGDEVSALFRPASGSVAIGGASGKVSLYDFDGSLRSEVLAALARSTPSAGPFEPPLED